MRFDATVLVGLALGSGALLLGFLLEGGRAAALVEGSAALIVFGGTMGAVLVSFSLHELRRLPRYFRLALLRDSWDPVGVIDRLLQYADVARRENRLALERRIADEARRDPFLAQGLRLVVDAGDKADDRTRVEEQLQTQMVTEEQALDTGAAMFEAAGGYAPTMGIVGTVMGLVHVLGAITTSPQAMVAGIATAFTATMYGVSSANLLWLPLANNLRVKARHMAVQRQIVLAGILGILDNTSSVFLKDRLWAFVEEQRGAAPAEEPPKAARRAR